MPGFWKIAGAATSIATTAVGFLFHYGRDGYRTIVLERERLKQADALNATQLASEVSARKGSDAQTDLRLQVLEQQLRSACEEHVRFVAASRHQDVEKTVAIYRELVEHWPCEGLRYECSSPTRAMTTALSARVPGDRR